MVVGLAAIVAVFLIIGGIRLATKSSPSGPSSTTGTRPAASTTHHGHVVVPIDSGQLTKYEGYAQGLQQANAVATRAFAKVGSSPTPTQLTPAVTSYRSALNLYDFQLHFIQWPPSMQTAIAVDHAQMKAFMSFLDSIATVSPTGTNVWLSGLQNRASSTQTADNQIRQDLGLPSSSSFP